MVEEGSGHHTPTGVSGLAESNARNVEREGRNGHGRDAPSSGKERAPSSRRALMEAAVELLDRDGVLAGLNVSEVAKRVGVTPANVYHFFGSRQGLLRDAIGHELARSRDALTLESEGDQHWLERCVRAFRALGRERAFALWSLLALDRDPDFEPNPEREVELDRLRRAVADGDLDADADLDALLLISQCTALAYAILRESGARQLGVTETDLDERVARTFERMLSVFAGGSR